jgi:hypothetical protein
MANNIELFKRAAIERGYNPKEVESYLQSKGMSTRPTGVGGMVKNVVNTALGVPKLAAGALYELPRALKARGGDFSGYVDTKTGKTKANPFMDTGELSKYDVQRNGIGGAVTDIAKRTAGTASAVLPFAGGMKAGGLVASRLTSPVVNSAATGALGEFAQDDSTLGSVAGAGVLGGVMGKVLPSLGSKISKWASKPSEAVKQGQAGGVLGKIQTELSDAASKRISKASPSVWRKAMDEHGLDMNKLVKKYYPKGANYDQALKFTDEGIQNAEKLIQQTAGTMGKNKVIQGDKIIKALKAELKTMSGKLGEKNKQDALKAIIAEAEKKYARGETVTNALGTLRDANKRFGKAVLETEGDAVATAAQKLEANVLRKQLKTMFPQIRKALDEQTELYTLKPVLENARAILNTQGSKIRVGAGGLTLDPLQMVENIADVYMANPTRASNLLQVGANTAGATGMAANKMVNTVKSGVNSASNVINKLPKGVNYPSAMIRAATSYTPTPQGATMPQDTTLGGGTASNTPIDYGLGGLTPEVIQRAMIIDLTQTGGKNQAKLQGILDAMEKIQKMQGGTSKGVGKAAAKDVATARSGIKSLDQLESMMTSGKLFSKNLPFNIGARDFTAAERNVMDAIARLRTGAAMTKKEEEFYASFMPKYLDSPQVRAQKIEQLRSYFSDFANAEAGITADQLIR